jgi:hypothetical protein
MSVRIPILIVTIVAITTIAGATQQGRGVTGFFSTLHYGRESGDLGGVEIVISQARVNNPRVRELPRAQYYAYVQIAEGSPQEPQLVPVQVDGNRVSFTLGGSLADISPFTGSVVGDSLIGRFTNGWQLRLPRRCSYWQ